MLGTKWTLALMTFLSLAAAPLRAETTYYNVQLQAGVDVLYESAYGEKLETYAMELHWRDNRNAESFNFELVCGSTVLESIWSRAHSTYVRFTLGSDAVTRCRGATIKAKITTNNIPEVYLQVLDYISSNRPATTTPALGTSCMGYVRLLNINETEVISVVPFGNIEATCKSTGMTDHFLRCDTNAVRDGSANACRLGRSCGTIPHNQQRIQEGGCQLQGIKKTYAATCNDGVFGPNVVISETTCHPKLDKPEP